MRPTSSALRPILLVSLTMLVTGYWLQGNPQCKRGCQTLAQHLINHGWKELLGLI